MKFYLGVTDNNWFNYLSTINPEDINFWQPSGTVNFKVLSSGAPFLFKLKSPLNAIGGVGFFSSHTFLPMSVAWDVFGNRNGCSDYRNFSQMILNHRKDKTNVNPNIGCIVLNNPIFFKKEDWIETPINWGNSIVQGKSYDSEDVIGKSIWGKVQSLINKYAFTDAHPLFEDNQFVSEPEGPAYGRSTLQKARLGQGAFRVLITDAYSRRCAITGEKTLPVLEAAHIKPYAEAGPHTVSNGLLLRSDMHKLFDNYYLTITKDLKIEVSGRIKEEFQNGKEYYQHHGKDLMTLPKRQGDMPDKIYIDWHNERFRG